MSLREPPLGAALTSADTNVAAPAWIQWFTDVFKQVAKGAKRNIITKTLDNTATNITFLEGIGPTYLIYEIRLVNIKLTGDAGLQLLASTDAGSTYVSSYKWTIASHTSNLGLNPVSNTGDTKITLNTAELSAGDYGECNGKIIIVDPSDTTTYKKIKWDLTYVNSGDDLVIDRGYGIINTTSAITGLKIATDDNTTYLESGRLDLYGSK